jgi:cbb3-type cytochrome oxidase subunit 3
VALMSTTLIAGAGIASGVMAGVLLIIFVALCLWAYSSRRRPAFDAASRLPLEEDRGEST